MIDIIDGELKISVRHLVEFLCRRGNLDNRFRGISDKTAMDAGSKAHRRIQKAMGPDYRSEVFLSVTLPDEKYNVEISGRADGIFFNDGITFIDEIKGTYKEIRYLSEPAWVHKTQAMCYAYIYGIQNGIDKIGIRMTYVNLFTDEIKYFEEITSVEELAEWFTELVIELRRWGDYLYNHRMERNNSIEGLEFPFEYREGQRNLAVSVYRAIERENNLFIQAPTGVGKTISTVFPAVKSMGKGCADKIFYLTAKTITRTAAEEAFNILREQNLIFKTVTITAKEKMCLLERETGPDCNPDVCIYANGHYDRVNEAVFDLINSESVITRDTILAYADKYRVCPFELCLDVTYWVDGIICDYNYVFDPNVKLKRFFGDGSKGNYVFLVDEAHNLVDRAREMYSAPVFKDRFLTAKKLVLPYSKRLASALERCNRNLLAMKRECVEEYNIVESDTELALNLSRLESEFSRFMENNREFPYTEEILELYFDVMHFNGMYEIADDSYVKYCEHTDEGFMYKLFCVNPGTNISVCISKGRMGVFFSATLLPINYYKELLTGNAEEYAIYANSPFDVNKRLLMIGKDVTSRYTRRNYNEYYKIKEYICRITEAKKGNYLVFFPSYKYMNDVYELFAGCGINIIPQNNNMSETDKEQFLDAFNNNKEGTLIGFCVLGGVFSEGIDLKKDSLIGSIIVGPGLPSISTTCQILRKYYDDKENKGYEYAYVYPGMNKVLQAAGRVIRTDEDMGIITLLDDRFLWENYINLFPKEWSNYRVVTKDTVQEEVLDFWSDMIYNTTESVF